MSKPGSSWATTSSRKDPMRQSLVDRAKKRRVSISPDPGWFYIEGNPSLGDHYDRYEVRLRDDGTWYCACQGNKGGEYRSTCSHVTGAMLYVQDHGNDLWDTARNDAVETDEVDGGEDDGDDVELEPELDVAWIDNQLVDVDGTDEPDAEDDDAPENESDVPAFGEPLTVDTYLDPEVPRLPSELVLVPSEPPMPDKFERFERVQWEAITEIVDALDNGFQVVMVSAPTGAGKTVIAESIRRLMATPAVYMCTTKSLQDQIMRDFDEYAKVLKGRANYTPLQGEGDVTCDDCTKEKTSLPACVRCVGFDAKKRSWNINDVDLSNDGHTYSPDMDDGGDMTLHCTWCHPVQLCPYTVARDEAAFARLAVLNTSYFLTETNKAKGVFAGWDLALIDEADKLEEELMRFVEVTITPYQRRDLGIGLPKKKTVEQAWVDWVNDEVIPAIKKKLKLTVVNYDLTGTPDIKAMKQKKRYERMLKEVEGLIELVEDEDGEFRPRLQEGWVYTGYENKEDKYVTVTFKPVMVDKYAPMYLWNKAKQFILMSATLISAEQMAVDLGLEDGQWTVVEVPSSFPVERRPVLVETRTKVTYKTKKEAYPILVEDIDRIMRDHPHEKILVHSVSYEVTRFLHERLSDRSRLHTYMNANEREAALDRFLQTDNGVIIAPSFDRGIDLYGDDCRVIVVAKVPYPFLGDAQIKKRTYGTGLDGKRWFATQTIRAIVQMTGRGMRRKDDWCLTYILDSEFSRLYGANRRLFPRWWADAVLWDRNDPKSKKVLSELGEWEGEG